MIDLFKHNQNAYDAALSMLAETGKAAIIHPTGTGKSFIGFKYCEDFPEKTVCWLSPSEYIFKTQIENWKAAGGEELENIKFYTYAKLMNMSENEIDEIKPDVVVCDEFHRAGADRWQTGVENLLKQYPNTPILGLSATNIRYLDNQRDMADELFDGNVASEMTLGEAIVRGILNPPKYVLSVFSYQKDLEKYERRVKHAKSKAVRDAAERYLEALRRALDKADGLDEIFAKHITDKNGKYIVFCANKEHMDEMIQKTSEWFAKIDATPHIYSAYADDPATNKAFAEFKKDSSDHLKLLFCIDMLNEDIHVEDVSGVILLRPTVSPIIYKQQIGRALSASKKTDAVIFDIVLNIENLYSIDSVEEEMRVAMTYYRSLGEGDEIVNDRFKVIDELRDCRTLFEKLNDTLTATWDVMYSYAKAYYEEHGDLYVPSKYKTADGYYLGNWLQIQRRVYRGEQFGVLGEDRIAKLNAIGMTWDSHLERQWNKYFSAAQAYYAVHGNLNTVVGYISPDGILLGRWICQLRTHRKSGIHTSYLTEERIAKLDALGMIWDVPDYQWTINYSAAMRYHQIHGNLDVPIDYVDPNGIRLGMWLNNMKQSYRGKYVIYRITDEQIAQLNALGIVWETKQVARWEKGFAEARRYYENNGNLDVPATYRTADGFKLGDWISNQREKHRYGKMKKELINRLNEVGMIWQKEYPWEVRFALAEAYYQEHGNLRMPGIYNVDGICLSKWINEQKHAYRGNRPKQKLNEDQIKRLESIGMDWRNENDVIWERRYAAVKAYYDEHGDIEISKDTVLSDGKKLGNCLLLQRKYYKDKKLSDEQIAKLNAIGMVWKLADPWEIGFAHAKAYRDEYGNLIVPSSYSCADGYRLGNWIANQRNNYNNPTKCHRVSATQAEHLESIGMIWNVSEHQWNNLYECAAKYVRENGHLNVPARFKTDDGSDLYDWLQTQKRAFRNGTLSEEQAEKLKGIGVVLQKKTANRSRVAL